MYRAIRACTFAGRYWEPGETTEYIPGIEKCRHFEQEAIASDGVQKNWEEEVKTKRRRGAG